MESLQKRDPHESRAESNGTARNILHLCVGFCAAYYLLLANQVQGDFQGDSWEYISLAAQMKAGLFKISDYRYLRGLFYPWFLSVTWGADGLLTYFLQGALFLLSLYLALRVIALGRLYCLLAVAAAMIPWIAFLQTLIYPDGMLLSLTLLFFTALARRLWWACAALGVLLALTKLVFGVVLPIALLVFLLEKPDVRSRIPRWSVACAILLAPLALWIAGTYGAIDQGYMVVFARPYWHGVPLERLVPVADLRFRCGGVDRTVAAKELNFHPITAPESTAAYGPFTEDQAKAWRCSTAEVHAVMRALVTQEWARDPAMQAGLVLSAFATAFTGGNDMPHAAHILGLRRGSWVDHYDERLYFEPYELELRTQYRNMGFAVEQRPPLVFRLNEWSWLAEGIIRTLAIGGILCCLALAYRRGTLRAMVEHPSVIGIGAFLYSYSLIVAVSAPLHVYDRYTAVNLMLLCLLAARLAAITLERKAPDAQLGGATEPVGEEA